MLNAAESSALIASPQVARERHTGMPTERINKAIRDCLQRCQGTESPVACLALFCDELRQGGWNDSEVLTVEVAVIRILSIVVDVQPQAVSNCPKCNWPDPVVIGMDTETIYRCSDCQHQWIEAKAG
jgi:hypothetical protein